MNSVDVSRVQTDRMGCLSLYILISEEVIRTSRGSCHITGSLQTEYEQVVNEAVVLNHERGELQSADYTIWVRVIHVLKKNDTVNKIKLDVKHQKQLNNRVCQVL